MGWTQLTAHHLVLDVLRPRLLSLRCREHHAVGIDSSMIISKKEVSREIHVDEEDMEHRFNSKHHEAFSAQSQSGILSSWRVSGSDCARA